MTSVKPEEIKVADRSQAKKMALDGTTTHGPNYRGAKCSPCGKEVKQMDTYKYKSYVIMRPVKNSVKSCGTTTIVFPL